ncbi:uncharacterized protein LOC135134119 isoform X2 [Zophobas morio]|uniref:uncharacterized protein LOC135134119 isoform X2 n=1 Tax=Zophobas morio TaxID=2755281 RepID=UPI003082E75E
MELPLRFMEYNDIYPFASVNGTEIRGSCSTFHTRKENNGVRKFSVDKAIKLYDQKLVFMGDQSLRSKALINEETDPNIELQDVEYYMLEKIGRSRDQGEFTQSKMSLPHDVKKVYHNRKVLLQHYLIAHQSFCLKSLPMRQNISGGLIHLSRFYRKRKTKQIAIMERVSHILKSKPNNQIELNEFRKIFGRNISLVKLIKTADFRKFFKLYIFPYRKLYPNATKQEYLNKNKLKERDVKVLRMIDPYANVTALMDAKDSKEISHEKTDNSPGYKVMNYEYLRQIFLYILSSEQVGVTIQEIHDHFKTDFYTVRLAVRKLLVRNVIRSSKIDLGRQQSLKFFAKCYAVDDCHIQMQPKVYELSDETISRVLKNYDHQGKYECPSEPETPPIPAQTHFKLSFEPFCCTSFLTETVDSYSEELTIYDIVSKGRDKLLLIESNISTYYMSEWDDFFLKREDFFKSIQLFQNGFGKVIYNFLMTVCLNESLQADNEIVFAINNIASDGKIRCHFNPHRMINIPRNFTSAHSDNYHLDAISKIYILEAMLSECHKPNHCVEQIKSVFERFMLFLGKRKRKNDEPTKAEPKIEVQVSSNVVMEKYMGATPTVEWCGQDAEITVEVFASTKPKEIRAPGSMFSTDDVNVTQRYINRANLILSTVYEQKVVPDVWTLYKDVVKEEGEEGYDKKACRKSIVSIITRLVAEGYIKCYKIIMNGKNMTKTQSFMCVHEVGHNHGTILSNIEHLKLKFYVGGSHTQKTVSIKKKKESPFSNTDVRDSISELKQLAGTHMATGLKVDKTKGKIYGYTPKFVRMRVLHEHLFYVIREMTECDSLTTQQVFELFKNSKIKLSPTEISEMPPIYRNEVSWKMFIPCMPLNTHRPKGWALACDFVLRMPLSVFVKLYNIQYDIPELETYLHHPIKKHYLLRYLPPTVRNILLHRRKYFHSIYETICNLCYVGLVQLGPRSVKEKDQIFVYLNSKATLFDTCSSKPGYNHIEDKKYKKISIEFKTGNDIEIYWSEMLRICMNTQLGRRKILDGQIVTIEECSSKPAMFETLRAKQFDEAVSNDNGMIPGDHRGAAGFDSSVWSFVKRNWVWNATKEKGPPAPVVKKEKIDIALPEAIQYDLVAKGGPPERKIYLKKKSKKKVAKPTEVKRFSKKKFMRKITAPKKKRMREYYDAIDRSIMKKNPGIKVTWTEEEDQLLRYCRIACVFLCPVSKKQFIPYNILRDVLHQIHPPSKNKTARAIQRRIYVLLTHDEILKNMETNVENLLNSDSISKYFEQIHNRYKNGKKLSDTHIYIAFVYLMSYICKHKREVELLLLDYFTSFDFFSDVNIADFEPLLQSCEDTTNAIIYTAPKTVEDITKDTIKSVVHCSMACRKNTSGWILLLSRIYKKFQDDLVRAAEISLKKHQFFVHNKSAEVKTINNPWPSPIKFSHVYNVMKTPSYTPEMYKRGFKNFAALITRKTGAEVPKFLECNELNSFWEKINFVFDVPEMGIIMNPEIEDHSEVIEELAKRFQIYLDQIYRKNNGPQKSSLSSVDKESPHQVEKNIDEIKDEVRHLIFRVPYLLEGNLDMCFRKMLDSNSILEISNYIFLMIVDLKKFAETSISVEDLRRFVDEIEDDVVDDHQKLMTSLSKIVFAIQNIHQSQLEQDQSSFEEVFKLWEAEVWDEVRIEKDEDTSGGRKPLFTKNYASGMEHSIKQAQEGDFPSLEEIKEGIMSEVANSEERKIPHITDLIMLLNEDRFPHLDTDVETIERMKDHFVMQYPKLEEFVVEDLEQMMELDVIQKLTDDSIVEVVKQKTDNIVGPCQLDRVIKYIRSRGGSEDDVKVVEDMVNFIREKKEFGTSGRELKINFEHKMSLSLVDILHFLDEINVILRTGVVSIVYVYHEYQSEWLVETFLLSPKEREMLESKQKQEIEKKLKNMIGEKILSSDPRKVQLKPWTHLDGSINDEVFHGWLASILCRCTDFPNIPFMVLCEHFHYIKPVDMYLLLEILEALGCVDIYVLKTEEKGLFSERRVVAECKATCLDKFEDMFVRPTNVAGLCFGSFLDKVLL